MVQGAETGLRDPLAVDHIDHADVDDDVLGDGPIAQPVIEFCGERIRITTNSFTIGRAGDFSIDEDNQFLHRNFLMINRDQGIWFLTNVGRRLTATASDGEGRCESVLSPRASVPLTTEVTVVRFGAGACRYEFEIHLPHAPFVQRDVAPHPDWREPDGDMTRGRVQFTPDQLLLVLVLAEPALRDGRHALVVMPTSSDAAQRLGWTITKFNRKLDNVCQKLTNHGVRGLHGETGNLAFQRRARLVEYALGARLVTRDDLSLLDAAVG